MLELLLVKLEPFTYVGNEDKNIIGGSEFSVNISDDEPLEYEVVIKQYCLIVLIHPGLYDNNCCV